MANNSYIRFDDGNKIKHTNVRNYRKEEQVSSKHTDQYIAYVTVREWIQS